jgi:precorrin-8X/cobalt-precorrin-8 methylmutase
MPLHPITAQSFAIIDQEIGPHGWAADEYALVRRAIHATADFDLSHRFSFSPGAIAAGIQALRTGVPVLVDVRMVAMGVASALAVTSSPLYCALDFEGDGSTRTAAGMAAAARQYPDSIMVVGNAPTALLALVDLVRADQIRPALVIGVPVGFVAVEEAKRALGQVAVPQIQVRGRKGGSPVAAALVNALVELAIAPSPERLLDETGEP